VLPVTQHGAAIFRNSWEIRDRIIESGHFLSVQPGARLGPYEILSAIGAGGMGEVYRARDTRLDRTVAIKTLRETHAGFGSRFAREAKAIAALAHPNICTLFDVGHEASSTGSGQPIDYLVMECLEGETLAGRLKRGPLPLDQALKTAIEIGDALDQAHHAGIVHRDLKPSNVMLTKTGAKLLDFGLAKLRPAPSGAGAAAITESVSGEGVLTGTVPYMAPEQLEGRDADARSDLFAFGAVLYEMATGRRAFVGESQASVIAAILEHDPPAISTLQPLTPPALDRVVRKCLAKDPEDRWQTARDLVDELKWVVDVRTSAVATRAPLQTRRTWKIATALAIVCLVLVAASAVIIGRPRPAGSIPTGGSSIRFEIAPPAGTAFGISPASPALAVNAETASFQLSPDGSRLAFVAAEPSGRTAIWLRPMSTLDARVIPGTEDARSVFWSPDSRSIAFSAGGKLQRLDLSGGPPAVPLCDVTEGPGVNGTWGNGAILFTQGGRIYRVPTSGGRSTTEVEPDASSGEISVGWPWFLPDGRRFLYVLRLPGRDGRVMLADPGKPPVAVLSALSNVQWIDPDNVVFAREGTLLEQRVDLASFRSVGDPVAIVDTQHTRGASRAAFSVSRTGALVYQAHADLAELVWFDRSGRELGPVGPRGDYLTMRISPDGRQALAARADPRTGMMVLRLLDFDRPDAERRLTSEPRSEMGGVWMPNGTGAFFSAEQGPALQLFYKDLGTGAERHVVLPAKGLAGAEDVSPDGQLLAFFQRTDDGGQNLWTMPVDGTRAPSLLAPGAGGARFSLDGRFVAFVSRESGHGEVYVAPSSPSGQRTRVSTQGGDMPRWGGNGHEIFYRSADGHIVSVAVRTRESHTIELGPPVTLFAVKGKWPWRAFDMSPEGRFLAIVPRLMTGEQSLTAVLNWTSELAR
jgi:eukaryotic-like serine/threonine-protein kinase